MATLQCKQMYFFKKLLNRVTVLSFYQIYQINNEPNHFAANVSLEKLVNEKNI